MGNTGSTEAYDCIKKADLEVCPKSANASGMSVIIHYVVWCECEDEVYDGGDGSDGDIPGSLTGHDDGKGQCMKMHVEQNTHSKCGNIFNRNCSGRLKGVLEFSGIQVGFKAGPFAELFMECFSMDKKSDAATCIKKKLAETGPGSMSQKEWEESFQAFKDSILGRGGHLPVSSPMTDILAALRCYVDAPGLGGGGPPIRG